MFTSPLFKKLAGILAAMLIASFAFGALAVTAIHGGFKQLFSELLDVFGGPAYTPPPTPAGFIELWAIWSVTAFVIMTIFVVLALRRKPRRDNVS